MPRKLTDRVTCYESWKVSKGFLDKLLLDILIDRMCPGISARYTNAVLRKYSRSYILVYRVAKIVRGFAVLHVVRGIAYLDLICSSVRGAGKELMASAELFMKEKGAKRVRLFAIPQAEAFYRKVGYAETGDACSRKPLVRRSGNRVDGYRYEKCLSPPGDAGAPRGPVAPVPRERKLGLGGPAKRSLKQAATKHGRTRR